MTVVQGDNTRVYVEDPANPGVYILVANMNRADRSATRTRTTTRVFGGQYNRTGPRDEAQTYGGLFDPADPGQLALMDAIITKTEVNVRIVYGDGKQVTQRMRVTNVPWSASPDDLETIGFEFAGVEPPVMEDVP